MSFGTKASKDNTPKSVKKDKPDHSDVTRENAIVERIAYYVENSDAGVIGLKHISEKMKGIKNIESFVEKCVEKYHYIYHKGWVYGRQWSIDDVNKISNDNITLDNFDISNKEVTK